MGRFNGGELNRAPHTHVWRLFDRSTPTNVNSRKKTPDTISHTFSRTNKRQHYTLFLFISLNSSCLPERTKPTPKIGVPSTLDVPLARRQKSRPVLPSDTVGTIDRFATSALEKR